MRSAKQARSMPAHNPASKVGIPVAVAREFNAADMGGPERLTSPGGVVKRGGYIK